VGRGKIRIDDHRLAKQFHREVMAAHLVGHDAEEAQRVCVPWLRRKDLAVEPLGFRQPSGSVMLQRNLKCL
jgi:hypothetical protein